MGQANSRFFVYGHFEVGAPLVDGVEEIRYVGGSGTGESRPQKHLVRKCGCNPGCSPWRDEVLARGGMIAWKVLATCEDYESTRKAETAKWNELRCKGHRVQPNRPNGCGWPKSASGRGAAAREARRKIDPKYAVWLQASRRVAGMKNRGTKRSAEFKEQKRLQMLGNRYLLGYHHTEESKTLCRTTWDQKRERGEARQTEESMVKRRASADQKRAAGHRKKTFGRKYSAEWKEERRLRMQEKGTLSPSEATKAKRSATRKQRRDRGEPLMTDEARANIRAGWVKRRAKVSAPRRRTLHRCRKCRTPGHNARTCKRETGGDSSAPAR